MRYLGIALSCALVLGSAHAKVFRYVDANGNTVFTDQPPLGVEAAEHHISPPNTTSLPTAESQGSSPDRSSSATQAPYRVLELQGLPDSEALRANNGSFSLQVQTEPPLRPSHRLQLLVDGQPHGAPMIGTSLQAHNLDRGEHQIAVQVLSGDRVVQTSVSHTLYIQRTHTNSPRRRP